MLIWNYKNQEGWIPIELIGEVKIKRGDGEDLVVSNDKDVEDPLAILYPWQDHKITRYILIRRCEKGEIKVNGYPIIGLRVLNDKDEIIIKNPDQMFRAYFSTESLPRVMIYDVDLDGGADVRTVFCVRCKGQIERGQKVVRCPQCGFIYHEMEDRGCWTYDKICAGCKRRTNMDYSWRPEPIRRRHGNKRDTLFKPCRRLQLRGRPPG